jgi:hypothetical protein
LLLSSAVPWRRRGYHASGTVIERPSVRSTIKLSSVTTRLCARTSATKVLIPTPNQILNVVFHKLLNAIDFATAKTTTALQSHRIEPELGNIIVALNVDMFWLVAIAGVEEEPIRSDS